MKYEQQMKGATESMSKLRGSASGAIEHLKMVEDVELCILNHRLINKRDAIIINDYLIELLSYSKFIGSAPAGIDPEKLKKILETIVVIKGGKS